MNQKGANLGPMSGGQKSVHSPGRWTWTGSAWRRAGRSGCRSADQDTPDKIIYIMNKSERKKYNKKREREERKKGG